MMIQVLHQRGRQDEFSGERPNTNDNQVSPKKVYVMPTAILDRTAVLAVGKIAAGILLAASLSTISSLAQAQEWPTRSVKFVVPLAPGGGADIGARLAADKLQKIWNQPVVVENRPGGDSLIAIRQVLGAADDHTMLFTPSGSVTAHPYRHEKLDYNRPTDLLPVARVSNTVVGIAVSTSLGITTLKEFVDLSRASPGKMNIVVPTGITELLWDSFAKSQNINVVKVPYTNLVQGANDMGTDRVQASLSSLAILQPSLQGKVARLIVLTGPKRISLLPDIMTAREAGFPGIEYEGLNGVFGSKAMSLALRQRVGKDIAAVAGDPEIASKLAATGQVPNPGGVAEFGADIEAQERQVDQIAKILGMVRKN
jgi:tripartite-type tricarboxylate transporter receptor subunit TctC